MVDNGGSSAELVQAHRLFWRGLIVSIAYVVLMLIYASRMWDAMIAMNPDQFATFLSGIFAPLAFLWLVLGFRQQGDELQNSARALWLQGEELRNSVEQQRALVEVSREQLTADAAARMHAEDEVDRAAQPQLVLSPGGGSYSGPKRSLSFELKAAGPACSSVLISVGGKPMAEAHLLREGERAGFTMEYDSPDQVAPLDVTVAYTDQRGNRRAQKFFVPVNETGGPGGDRTLGVPVKLPGLERITVGAVDAALAPVSTESQAPPK
jgi:hypothetical protein